MFSDKKKKIVTHNGSFHADDLFACAFLKILFPDAEIVRTRDEKVIAAGDIVLDVGGIYDPTKHRYDHHQKGGAGVRENGVPYASAGLIWKNFGLEICDNNQEVWHRIERKIIMPIDATDNGVDLIKESLDNLLPYFADQVFLSFSPTWREGESQIDEVFVEQVEKIKPVLQREIKVAFDDVLGKEIILSAVKDSKDPRLVVLDKPFPRYLYQNTLCQLPDVLFVILPRERKEGWKEGEGWKVEAIRKNSMTLNSRKYFPETWRGLRDEELQKVSGVKSAIFCHNGGFMMTIITKDDAFVVAQKALES